MPIKRLPLLLLSNLLFALPAAAQDPIEDRWFKVELMIFSHRAAPSGSEQWEPTPRLEYPAEFRFLVEPELVAANIATHPGESVVDEFGRQIITLDSEDADTTGDSIGNEETDVGPEGQDPFAAGEQTPPVPLTPTPFIALPSSDKTFHGKAAYMQRSGRYRTLFHEAWYQPFADENRTLPIVIDRSGDTGEWPQLQGSVKIYLSRYLHIETDLWLNTDGSYLPGEWQMPAPPFGPPSLIIEEPFSDIVEESLPEIEASYRSGPDPDWEESYRFEPAHRMYGPASPHSICSISDPRTERHSRWQRHQCHHYTFSTTTCHRFRYQKHNRIHPPHGCRNLSTTNRLHRARPYPDRLPLQHVTTGRQARSARSSIPSIRHSSDIQACHRQ